MKLLGDSLEINRKDEISVLAGSPVVSDGEAWKHGECGGQGGVMQRRVMQGHVLIRMWG